MKIPASVVISLCLFSILASAQTPQPTISPTPMNQEEIIRISSNLILVDALVLDKKGQQVTNLTAGDFDIFQDGKPQTIINFGYISPGSAAVRETETSKTRNDKNSVPLPPISVRSNQGRVITFVIDDGNCLATVEGLEVARDAMKKFIDLQMLPDDKVAIYRTRGGTSLLQLYTSNKEALKRVVNKVNWLPSACGSAFDPARSDTTFSRQSTLGNYGKETFESKEDKEFREARENYERDNQIIGSVGVLNFVVERLKNLPQRKVVFFLSEGIQMKPDGRGVDALREVADKASRSSVVIYTMSNKGLTVSGMISAQDEALPGITGGADETSAIVDGRIEEERSLNDGLSYLAYTTGGEFIRNKNFLDSSIKRVLTKETGYYLIGYQPEDETFKGKEFHKIEVRVKRPELIVSSRKGFYGRAGTETKAKNKTTETPLYQAISSPLQQNGMDIRLTTIVGNEASEGNFIRAIFHVKGEDFTFTDEPDGTKKVVLDVVAVTLDEKGRVVEEFNHTYPIRVPKQGVQTVMQNGLDYSTDIPIKKSGFYSFRIAVRDNNSKRLGSAGDFVEIPDLNKNKFYMSGLVTTSVGDDGKPILPKSRPANAAFAPVFTTSIPSIRRYQPGGVLAYTYNIYNAKPDNAAKKPKLTRQIRLYKSGKLILEGKETPVDAQPQTDVSRVQDFGIIRLNQDVQIGEYILQIVVRDTIADKTVSQWIDFEVVP